MDPLPTIAFCGFGRAGKDTAGRLLWRKTLLRYSGSLSWAGLPHMAEVLGMCPQDAWETRHKNRELWKAELDKFRAEDATKLIRLSLAQGQIVVGIRAKEELAAAKAAGLLTHTVWVHKRGTPVDPTVTYTWRDCDTVLFNNRNESEFATEIDSLVEFFNLPRRPTELAPPPGLA